MVYNEEKRTENRHNNRIMENIPSDITERRLASKRLQRLRPNNYTCKSCGVPAGLSSHKGLNYTPTYGYSPICWSCFHDTSVTFEDLIMYYTNRGTWEHENFKEEEVDYIIDSLIKNTENDPIVEVMMVSQYT